MRRVKLFLSRFLLSLWIVLAGAFLSLLLLNAPNAGDSPLALVSIPIGYNAAIYLPNRIFTCTGTKPKLQCQTGIQGRLLDLSITEGSYDQSAPNTCRAYYDEQLIGCREMSHYPIIGLMSYEITDLELSPQQLWSVKQKYRRFNALMDLGEVRLFQISSGLSFLAGISAALFSWFHPGSVSKVFVGFVGGFGMYRLVSSFLAHVFNIWNEIVSVVAIAASVAATLTIALMLWRRFNRFTSIPICIVSSLSIFSLCFLSAAFLFLGWNFDVDRSILPILMILFLGLAIATIIATVVDLLWRHTHQSMNRFLCLSSGFGAVAINSHLFVYALLGLGYAD